MNIAEDILDIIGRSEVEGNALKLPAVQLDRKTYLEVDKVLSAIGGKWDRKARAHLFDEPAADAIEQVLLTGTYERTKQDFGQFDSPSAVVGRVIELARIEDGMKVLEPSCGIGRIVAEARRAGGNVYAYEIDPKRAEIARQFFPSGGLACADFLFVDPAPVFDRVVMNPPFAKQEDIDHVLHAAKFLKPGGRLVSVMSASVGFRSNGKTIAFREQVAAWGGEFEPLPEGSFKVSGTMVNACIVSFGGGQQ